MTDNSSHEAVEVLCAISRKVDPTGDNLRL